MSELIGLQTKRGSFRRNLLTNVSMLALLSYLGDGQAVLAAAEDDRPVVWIELGGQAEQIDGLHQVFAPPFFQHTPGAYLKPMLDAQKPSKFSIGGEGKIAFEPSGSDWVFAAQVRYGRAQAARHDHRQTPYPRHINSYFGTVIQSQPHTQVFGDGQTSLRELHAVVDFRAGKDVGLGLFGAGAKSVISAGVRYAQFTSSSDMSLQARPEFKIASPYTVSRYRPPTPSGAPARTFHARYYNHFSRHYTAFVHTRRSSHGIGPSLSWDASMPVAGNGSDMTLSVDWGLNAAVLFGRQKAKTSHQTTGHYHKSEPRRFKYGTDFFSSYAHGPFQHTRSRTVTIPNAGAAAALSLKFLNAHFTAGYRADFFFGAMDTGLDARKDQTLGFYGPFASISFGIGG